MKSRSYVSVLVAALLAFSMLSSVMGCADDRGSTGDTVPVVSSLPTTSTLVSSSDMIPTYESLPVDELSTFQSKDPFVQQVVQLPTSTASVTSPTYVTTTTLPWSPPTTSFYTTTTRAQYVNPTRPVYTPTTQRTTTTRRVTTTQRTTTTRRATTTTQRTPTTRVTTTTTLTPTTTTTAPCVHTLKVLSIDTVDGGAAVTFEVDGIIYTDRLVGDVVATTWGRMQVVDVALSDKTVTLLYGNGNETVTLDVGGQIYD